MSVRVAESIDDLRAGQILLTKPPLAEWDEERETFELTEDKLNLIQWDFDDESVVILADPEPEPMPIAWGAIITASIKGRGRYASRYRFARAYGELAETGGSWLQLNHEAGRYHSSELVLAEVIFARPALDG